MNGSTVDRRVPRIAVLVVAAGAVAAIAAPSHAAPPNVPTSGARGLIEFDAPGATTMTSSLCNPGCGTVAYANNDLGQIVGYYTDPKVVPHGFIRGPDGSFTSFDAPGAGLGAGLNEGTVPYSINNAGVVGGQFQDSHYVFHGFVRTARGAYTTLDAPGAGMKAGQGTVVSAINNKGMVAGIYLDKNNVFHGWSRQGSSFVTFDPPGSTSTQVCYTSSTCLNDAGAITGFFLDANKVYHGFLRAPNGTITTFDAPKAIGGTGAFSINAGGEITGSVVLNHKQIGFVRSATGTFTLFGVPPGNSSSSSFGVSISRFGVVAGRYFNFSDEVLHGFSRSSSGKVTHFDAPGAGTGQLQGTIAVNNNIFGDVAGLWVDPSGLNHGFLWLNPTHYGVTKATQHQP